MEKRIDVAGLRETFAVLWAFWLTHFALRLLSLGRADAFGFPAVNKLEWYVFHAAAFDWLWHLLPVGLLAVPALLAGRLPEKLLRFWRRAVYVLLCAILLLTVVDQEVYRFMAMHFDRNMMATYGNGSSVREMFHMIGADLSVPWLPIVLFFAAIPCFLLLRRALLPRVRSLRFQTAAVLSLTLLFWLYVDVVWTGGNRERRLAPVLKVLLLPADRPVELDDAEFARLEADYRARWLAEEGDSLWVFGDPAYPYLRLPAHTACKDFPSPRCDVDGDGDGFPLREDCDDWNPGIRPGAEEVPSNGIDEDCSGSDEKPWNVVLALLESHRAVNSGLFYGEGSWERGTPLLDTLAKRGEHWSRMNAGGVPTIGALLSTHLGMPDHPARHISSSWTRLSSKSFVELFRDAGWQTRFFSSADPGWDNQTPWLNRWYDGWRYDRAREADAAMTADLARWAADSLDRSRPFLLTLITKANHYPFNRVEGMEPYPDTLSLQGRMLRTMGYTEAALAAMVDSLRAAGLMERTLLVVMADHGFSLGQRPEEHGSGQIGNGLHSEHTWIPLVVAGDHPRLVAGRRNAQAAGQADLGPTLLDLAGIAAPNHFTGHSLFRPDRERSSAWVFHGCEIMEEDGAFRYHAGWNGRDRALGDAVYDALRDRNETRNLLDSVSGEAAAEFARMQGFATLHAWAVEHDRIWPAPGM